MPSNTLLDIALSNPNGDFDILGTALGLFPELVAAAGDRYELLGQLCRLVVDLADSSSLC